uniref:Macrophage-expressed gene 1 protein n=1 Tax=Takifugu rubripes TaxID=31033 RepID=H2U6K2_TAKRU
MKAAVTVLSLFFFFFSGSSVPISRPVNWLRQCRELTNHSITALEVLPGGGWDNLRNMDMGRVMNISYFQCQTTEDGLYLIPDEFSTENQRMKTHQVKDSSITTRVQIRNFIYKVKAFPDFALDVRFAQQAKEIADAIENNQTKNADYLSEKMVLEFGTHVITSVDAGATLVEEDYLTAKYVSDATSKSSSITAQAGLNFFDKLKFDISSQTSTQSSILQGYQSNITYSIIQSHGGGIPFYPGMTLQKWQESTRNNLVAIDRSGMPLQYFINPNTFPDLPQPTVRKVSRSVRQAIDRYYKVNTRPGCIDINSKNFNFQANIDDKSCDGPVTNLSFGGVYQVCVPISSDAGPLCDALAQKNPNTGDFSCRAPYTPTLLRSERRQQSYTTYDCHDETHHCGFLGLRRCHSSVCQDNYHVRSATINTYWCSVNTGKAPENSGYLFGGIYSPSLINPLTNAKSCPANFIPLKFLSDGQMICISNDYEAATRFSVAFGGLFSCQSSNPLADSKQRCPPQFSQHLAAVSDGCEILYCVQSGLFTGGELLPVHLPPFTSSPLISLQATNTVMVLTEGEKSWVRIGQSKEWKLVKLEEMSESMREFDPHNQLTGGEKAGIAFGVLALMALVVVVSTVMVKRRRRLGALLQRGRGYEEIHDGLFQETETDETRSS